MRCWCFKKKSRASRCHVFLWLARLRDQQRPVRVHLDRLGEWVLIPAPASDQELIRAAAQLAMPTIHHALANPTFFESDQEFDVSVDTFHPHVTQAGQLPWDPASTPYLAE